jgi:hypothetical protein
MHTLLQAELSRVLAHDRARLPAARAAETTTRRIFAMRSRRRRRLQLKRQVLVRGA